MENCAHHRGKVHPAAFAPDRMAHALCQLDGIKAMNVKMGGKILKISMPLFAPNVFLPPYRQATLTL